MTLTAIRWLPTGIMIPSIVLLLRERGLDVGTVSVVFAVYSGVTAVLELPTGGLADVIGRRPVLLVSAALSVVGSIVFAVGRSAPVLGIGFAVLGVSRALDSGPLQAWYVDAVHHGGEFGTRRHRPQAGSHPGGGRNRSRTRLRSHRRWDVGDGIALPRPRRRRWSALSTPFLVAAVLGLLGAVVVGMWVRDDHIDRRLDLAGVLAGVPATVRTGAHLAIRRAPLRRITLLSLAIGATLAGLELLSPSAFADLAGGRSAAAGPYSLVVTLAFVGTAVGSVCASPLVRVLRSSPLVVLLTTVAAAASVVAVGAPAMVQAGAAYVATYSLLGVGGPLLDDLTHRSVTSEERATMLSVHSMASQVGGIVALVGLGAVASSSSIGWAFIVVSAVLAMASLTMFRFPRERNHDVDGSVLVPTAGFEPATHGLGNRCSIP